MSLTLAKLRGAATKVNLSRIEILALRPEKKYNDGRTKQSFKDETDINKIMARFTKTGTISHLAKYEGTYSDFSDFDFHEQQNMLSRGEEIFANLPAEIRREFSQSPAAFFKYVNDPENRKMKDRNLPALAEPGDQLPAELASADLEKKLEAAEAVIKAVKAASEPASEKPVPAGPAPEPLPKTPAGDA